MKKVLFLIAVALLVFIPSKVMAAVTEISSTDFASALAGTPSNGVSYNSTEEYYSLAAGEYKLTSDISILGKSLIISENVILDLNGKSITSNYVTSIIKITNDAEVTIKGNGSVAIVDWDSGCAIQTYNNAKLNVINGSFIAPFGMVLYDNSETTINAGTISEITVYQNANLTVNNGEIGVLNCENTSTTTINNGTIGDIHAWGSNLENVSTVVINNGIVNHISAMNTNLTINNGEFSNNESVLNMNSGANVVIKNGTFIAGAFSTVVATNPDGSSLKISGGTFKGPQAGLLAFYGVNVELTGGKFEATNPTAAYGAITFLETTDTTILARILGDGYTYNPTLIAGTGVDEYNTPLVHSQNKIEVVSTIDGIPSTLDNISTYIGIAIIATLGLFATIILTKKIIKIN